jgi:hypothetical protein
METIANDLSIFYDAFCFSAGGFADFAFVAGLQFDDAGEV